MINIKKYLNLEGFIVAVNYISVILISNSSSIPKYEISILNLALCIIYIMHSYNYLKRGVFLNTILLLTLSIIISSHSLDSQFYKTSYLGLFSYSLIGVSTYFINYLYLTKNKNNIELIRLYSYLSIIAGGITAFYFYNYTMKTLELDDDSGKNFFYYFLTPMPLLFYFIKDKARVFVFILVAIGVILSFKRSGFLIILITGFFLFKNLLTSNSKNIKYKSLFIICTIVCIIFAIQYIGLEKFTIMQERMDNISEDKGSGRLSIMEYFFEYFQSYRIDEYLLGHGYGGFGAFFKQNNSSHNDFIEVFFSHGILGLIAIIIMAYKIIKNTVKLRKTVIFIPMISFCSMYIIFNLVSCVYHYYNFSLPIFIFIAYTDFIITNKKYLYYETTLG